MPTNTNAYNSRVTDEALEKRFRDTFRAQGGAELVDDLYAQGVIVPVVDFTQAATGDVLSQDLQQAWDFSTGSNTVSNTTTTLISNAGFWLVDLTCTFDVAAGAASLRARIYINDGSTTKNIWAVSNYTTAQDGGAVQSEGKFVVFLRSGDSLVCNSTNTQSIVDVWYRQIADVSGNLINPTGFTSS